MTILQLKLSDDELRLKLRQQAKEHGLSEEEEHLRILSQALEDVSLEADEVRRPSFVEFLMNGGDPWPDGFIPERSKTTDEHRTLVFE